MALGVLIIGVAVIGISGLHDEARLKRAASRIETTARESLLSAITQQRVIEVDLAGGLGGEGRVQVRRTGDKTFRDPQRGEVWEFSPTGVCEPIEVRVMNPGGVIELGFDPLTGCARRKSVIVNG